MQQTPVLVSDVDRHIRLSDGRWLGYAEYGDPSGKTILYFHGGLSSRLDVAFSNPLCRARKIRLLSVDRPGIGLSDLQKNRKLLDWPDDICELAHTLNLDRFAVLGWSGGGPYALACAFKIPERLTYVGIAAGMCPLRPPATVHELGLLIDRILFPLSEHVPELAELLVNSAKHIPATVLKWLLEQELTSSSDLNLIRTLNADQATNFFYEAVRFSAQGTVNDYRILGDEWGFKLTDIVIEVQLWQGEEDFLLPMAHVKYLTDRLRFSKLTIVPGQGHFLLRAIMNDVLSRLTSE